MSSGFVVAPAAVLAAAGALPILAIAGAAVLAVSAAHLAAEQAALKAAEYGKQLERTIGAQARGERDARIWVRTATHVVELNARIAMLAAHASRAGMRVPVPELLNLSGYEARQASAWCVSTAEHLRAGQLALYERASRQQLANAADKLPQDGLPASRQDASMALARYQEMMRERYLGEIGGPIVTRLDADMQVALRSLDPDAYEEEHAQVLAAAVQLARHATYAPEISTSMANLRTTINQINRAVARRRLAAKWLHALLDPVVADMTPPAPYAGTAAKLRRVVSGDGELDEALRREALKAVEWAHDAARSRYLTHLAHTCFTKLGYELAEEFDVRRTAALEYRKAAWSDVHRARVWVGEHGVVQGRVLSAPAEGSDAVPAQDEELSADLAEDLRALSRRIAAAARAGGRTDAQVTCCDAVRYEHTGPDQTGARAIHQTCADNAAGN
jgi:hypothetical protein